MTLAVDCKSSVGIAWLIESNDSVLEMSEDIFLLYFYFASSLLLIVVKDVRTVRTYYGVVLIFVDLLQVEYLPILQILKTLSCHKADPIISRIFS